MGNENDKPTLSRKKALQRLSQSRQIPDLEIVLLRILLFGALSTVVGFTIMFSSSFGDHLYFAGDALAQSGFSLVLLSCAAYIPYLDFRNTRKTRNSLHWFFIFTIVGSIYLMWVTITSKSSFGLAAFTISGIYLTLTVYTAKISYWVLRIRRPNAKELKRQDVGIMFLAATALLAKLGSDANSSIDVLNDTALVAACLAFGLQLAKLTHEYTSIDNIEAK